MKIRDVEEKIGISCKNIRFYEKEGLLSPKRNSENGYREYSDVDIARLKEIKLFRKLGITIEDIRLLLAGEIDLRDLLQKQIHTFENQMDSLNKANNLCIKIQGQNLSLDEIDADIWLAEMIELEEKGVKFMDISNDEIIRFLPDKFKMKYYESIIRNGQIDNSLLGEIMNYFEETYKKTVDTEKLFVDILKKADYYEKSKLLSLVKENNPELYSKLSGNIFDFEDMVTLDMDLTRTILDQFETGIIVKASMVASPKVNEYLKGLFPNIDFVKERQAIGSVPLNEVIKIHDKILEALNNEI